MSWAESKAWTTADMLAIGSVGWRDVDWAVLRAVLWGMTTAASTAVTLAGAKAGRRAEWKGLQ